MKLRLLLDDGCVLYLDGEELLRSNMPAGPIAFETLAKQIGRLELTVDRNDLPWTREIFLRGAASIPVRRVPAR